MPSHWPSRDSSPWHQRWSCLRAVADAAVVGGGVVVVVAAVVLASDEEVVRHVVVSAVDLFLDIEELVPFPWSKPLQVVCCEDGSVGLYSS